MKIKKGDNIIVIAGKDRGKTGVVHRALPKIDQVLVEGVNIIKKHQKANKKGSVGQIIERPAPIHISNVALVDTKSGKAARVGYTSEGVGKEAKKVRITRPSGERTK
jgi:large subunit ribosomal protein L24